MTIRYATNEEIASWDQQVIHNPDGGNVLQGEQFAILKQASGWQPRYIIADGLALVALEKRVFGLGKLWYIPKGPGVSTIEQLQTLLEPLRAFAKSEGVFVVKCEPELGRTDTSDEELNTLGLVHVIPIQPNFSTVVVDIHDDLETVLMGMPQKGRHAIRRAERDGVTFERVESSDDNCQQMYALLALTASSASFGIRAYDYYKSFWQGYAERNQGQLFFAYYEGQIVAGAYAVVYGEKSTYKDGASVRERTAYGASHLLQWQVITWAKERGSKLHDLCGIPPIAQLDNKEHRSYGLWLFKRSFNPEPTEYVGVYELSVRPFAHKLWRKFGERIVRSLYIRRHREDYY